MSNRKGNFVYLSVKQSLDMIRSYQTHPIIQSIIISSWPPNDSLTLHGHFYDIGTLVWSIH